MSDDEALFFRTPAELRRWLKRLKADRAAWADWEKRPPGYKRIVAHWIMSAKREETRERRLATLLEHAATGRSIPALARKPR